MSSHPLMEKPPTGTECQPCRQKPNKLDHSCPAAAYDDNQVPVCLYCLDDLDCRKTVFLKKRRAPSTIPDLASAPGIITGVRRIRNYPPAQHLESERSASRPLAQGFP